MSQGHELMWMDPADEKEEAGDEDAGASGVREGAGEKARQLEAELQAVRKELSDVRRDLAAKVVLPSAELSPFSIQSRQG